MGLDMYLRSRVYIGAYYEHNRIKGNIELEKDGNPLHIPLDKASEISLQVAYWRKENHIHKWFVDNVQEGTDDCGDYYVSRQNIQELVEICNKVAKNLNRKGNYTHQEENGHKYKVYKDTRVAEELLPTQSGFFFGGTEYDHWYVQGLVSTIEQLQEALKLPDYYDFYYSSSW